MQTRRATIRFWMMPIQHLEGRYGMVILCLAFLCVTSMTLGQETRSFERAEAQAIKDQAAQILSHPEYRARRTLGEWLRDTLVSWAPKLRVQSRWAAALFWIIMTWCLLTLLAILIHFLWTASLLIGSKRKTDRSSPSLTSLETHFDKSHEELRQLASQCALQQQYREAIGYQTLAAIKWLDSVKALVFHESKTNGDYLRECRVETPERTGFQQIIKLSELALYAGTRCNHQTYQDMDQLMEQMIAYAG